MRKKERHAQKVIVSEAFDRRGRVWLLRSWFPCSVALFLFGVDKGLRHVTS